MKVITYESLIRLIAVLEDNKAVYDSSDPISALDLLGELAEMQTFEIELNEVKQ